jgi:hypothetical protein
MNLQDPQVVLWTRWSGLTILAADHMQYSHFDHYGDSGGSHQPFTPRNETHLIGVRFGWWPAGPSDFVVYNPTTLEYMAAQVIYLADENPS